MKAVGKYIVVKKINEEVKVGRFALAEKESSEARHLKGEVVSAGTEVIGVKDGDKVYFERGLAFTLNIEGEEHTIIQERSVVIVL